MVASGGNFNWCSRSAVMFSGWITSLCCNSVPCLTNWIKLFHMTRLALIASCLHACRMLASLAGPGDGTNHASPTSARQKWCVTAQILGVTGPYLRCRFGELGRSLTMGILIITVFLITVSRCCPVTFMLLTQFHFHNFRSFLFLFVGLGQILGAAFYLRSCLAAAIQTWSLSASHSSRVLGIIRPLSWQVG